MSGLFLSDPAILQACKHIGDFDHIAELNMLPQATFVPFSGTPWNIDAPLFLPARFELINLEESAHTDEAEVDDAQEPDENVGMGLATQDQWNSSASAEDFASQSECCSDSGPEVGNDVEKPSCWISWLAKKDLGALDYISSTIEGFSMSPLRP